MTSRKMRAARRARGKLTNRPPGDVLPAPASRSRLAACRRWLLPARSCTRRLQGGATCCPPDNRAAYGECRIIPRTRPGHHRACPARPHRHRPGQAACTGSRRPPSPPGCMRPSTPRWASWPSPPCCRRLGAGASPVTRNRDAEAMGVHIAPERRASGTAVSPLNQAMLASDFHRDRVRPARRDGVHAPAAGRVVQPLPVPSARPVTRRLCSGSFSPLRCHRGAAASVRANGLVGR